MKTPEFLGMLFLTRNVSHSVHLNTRSYAKHMALADFYGSVIDFADKFAEAYQGKYGLIGDIPLQGARSNTNVTEFLQSQYDEITAARYDIVDRDCTALQNIVDEILGLYLSTLYKLRFLS